MLALTSLTLAGFGKRASSVPANEIFAHKFRLRLDELTLVAIVGFHIDNLINFREDTLSSTCTITQNQTKTAIQQVSR